MIADQIVGGTKEQIDRLVTSIKSIGMIHKDEQIENILTHYDIRKESNRA